MNAALGLNEKLSVQRGRTFRFLLVALLMICCQPWGWADGGFTPPVNYPRIPAIPGQTALLIHDGKTETLIVESSLQAEAGDRFAWILPVPSVPEAIEKVDAGLLSTLRFCIGPSIDTVNGADIFGLFVLLFLFLVSCNITHSILIDRKIWSSLGHWLDVGPGKYFVLLFIFFLLSLISVGESPKSTTMPMAGLLKQQKIGNYQVSVFKAKDNAALAGWLKDNQFASIPVAQAKAVGDYIREGWYFVISRLEKVEGQRATPHPLLVRFKSKEAIYPMRLTAMAPGHTSVRLYAAGPARFTHPQLETIFSDVFKDSKGWPIHSDSEVHGISGEHLGRLIAQPALMKLLPEGIWLTALEGRLAAEQMGGDLILQNMAGASTPYQKIIYSQGKVFVLALIWALAIFIVLSLFWAWICKRRKRVSLYVIFPVLFFLMFMLTLVSLSASLVTISENTVSIVEPRRHFEVTKRKIRGLYNELTGNEPKKTEPKQRELLRARILKEVSNPYQRQPIQEEASPGNFTIHVDSQGLSVVTLYDEYGAPVLLAPIQEAGQR